jgi:hypothetical protein
MDPDREGYPDDVPRPDRVSVHTALWLVHVGWVVGAALIGFAMTVLNDLLKHILK